MEDDRIRKRLEDLRKLPGNDICADCGKNDPDWAAYNLGIFICKTCAEIHKRLGSHISRVKSIFLDRWDEEQLQMMTAIGNEISKVNFERHVPLCYRRPKPNDSLVIIEQWIYGKYERLEFVNSSCLRYTNGSREGYLWKKGKKAKQFARRRFVLCEKENSLVYFNREEARMPKAQLRLDQLNVTVVPEKVGNPNGMQIMHPSNNSLRSMYIYAETGQDLVEWYTALRSAKFNFLSVAYPNANKNDLCQHLSRDFVKEGWLHKTGPRPGDAYRKRWVVLDDQKLYYYEEPLDPFPKGVISLGSRENGFTAREDAPPGVKALAHNFTLKTPDRNYCFSAASETDRQEWINALLSVIKTPIVPLDFVPVSSVNREKSCCHSVSSQQS